MTPAPPADAPGPLVSVMIPTYNQAGLLGAAIESALAQDYPHLEVVVCDDGSSDGTEAVVARYLGDPRLRFVRNVKNLGRVANYRHLLYDLARGEWAINLDGDDCFLDPAYIRLAMTQAMAHPGVVMVFAQALKGASPDAGELLNAEAGIPAVMDGAAFFETYPPFGTVGPLHLTCLYHRPTAMRLDFYRADILSSDFESLYRLMLEGKVAFLPMPAALWRQHGQNASTSTSAEALLANVAVFEGPAEHAMEICALAPAAARKWLGLRLARYMLSAIARAARGGLPMTAAARLAFALMRRHPSLVWSLPPAALLVLRDARRVPS